MFYCGNKFTVQAADEQHEIVLHQKDEQLRQKNAELEQIQVLNLM